MASITPRGNGFRIAVSNGRDINGKQIIETTTFIPDPNKTAKQNEKALKLFALEFEKQVKEGTLLDGNKLTYSKYIDIWLKKHAQQQMQVTTYEQAAAALNHHILGRIGHLKLTEIKPLHIRQIYEDMQKTGYIKNGEQKAYKASSIKRVHSVLSATLTTAVQWELIDSNPCMKVKPPKKEKNRDVKHFTLEEAQVFLNYIKQPYMVDLGGGKEKKYGETCMPYQLQVFYNLALLGGFRRGEILALTWKDIDFKTNTITISKSLAHIQGKEIVKSTKNESSIREVIVPASCIAMLKQLKAERNIISFSGEDFVFIQDSGKPMCTSTPTNVFRKTIRRYNADPQHTVKLPEISLHGLRHTSATLLISQNVDVKEVSSRLGHSTTSTTLDIYTHALKKRDEEASNIMGSLFEIKA